jgi:asparagine synthase (glutamine-hydrolysing)
MELSGERADEVSVGNFYYHKSPNDREIYEETDRKLDLLY